MDYLVVALWNSIHELYMHYVLVCVSSVLCELVIG